MFPSCYCDSHFFLVIIILVKCILIGVIKLKDHVVIILAFADSFFKSFIVFVSDVVLHILLQLGDVFGMQETLQSAPNK